jgi:RsiW-degrading membrane proteinase PrsW (M82 family)
VLVGGLSLALAPLTGGLTLLLFLPAFIIGFSFPSLIWISYVYGFEKRHNLPSRAVLTALVYGMLSTIPALIVNTAAGRYFGEGAGASLATMLVTAAVIAPLVEEFSKPWGLYLVRGEVRGPLDGLIMGVTCGVGFALIENITYELSFVFTGESAAAVWTLGSLARGLGSIMVHATGAGMIGYAYGRYRTGGGAMLIPLAYLAGVALHSLWNGSSAVFDTVSWGTAATVGFMFVFAVGAFLLLDRLIRMGTAFEDASRPPGLPPR